MATRHAWRPAQCVISRMGASCKLSLALNLYRALGRDAAPCTAQLSEPQQASKLCTSSPPSTPHYTHTHTHTAHSTPLPVPPADTTLCHLKDKRRVWGRKTEEKKDGEGWGYALRCAGLWSDKSFTMLFSSPGTDQVPDLHFCVCQCVCACMRVCSCTEV